MKNVGGLHVQAPQVFKEKLIHLSPVSAQNYFHVVK